MFGYSSLEENCKKNYLMSKIVVSGIFWFYSSCWCWSSAPMTHFGLILLSMNWMMQCFLLQFSTCLTFKQGGKIARKIISCQTLTIMDHSGPIPTANNEVWLQIIKCMGCGTLQTLDIWLHVSWTDIQSKMKNARKIIWCLKMSLLAQLGPIPTAHDGILFQRFFMGMFWPGRCHRHCIHTGVPLWYPQAGMKIARKNIWILAWWFLTLMMIFRTGGIIILQILWWCVSLLASYYNKLPYAV